MDPRSLIIHLETPYCEYQSDIASIRDIVLAVLQCSNDYWSSLAVTWLENGAVIDAELEQELQKISVATALSQQLRHRAFALAHRYLQQQTIEELDVVRLIKLQTKNRDYSGTEGVKRAPSVGDIGTVVEVLQKTDEAVFVVEAIDLDGYTI